MLLLHCAGWQCCLVNVVDGDTFPYTHSGAPRGPAVGPPIHFFFSFLAMMLTSVSYMVLKPRSPSPAMNAMLCDKEAQQCWIVSLSSFFWSSVSPFLFAAYAVIANGQVECPKGFKRMNLTHCQGKLQYMFKNVSAGINSPYIFMGDIIKK